MGADRLARLRQAFEAQYGQSPTHGARAPGRVDLMGSHTDYNQGLVMTVALDRDSWALARPADHGELRFHSLNTQSGGAVNGSAPEMHRLDGWTAYVQGVLVAWKRAGNDLPSCDVLIHSTVPLASGLSSSAALEVSVLTLLEGLTGQVLDPLDKARMAQRAENDWVGMPCGLLDQYSSVFGEAGHALQLDCRATSHRQVSLPQGLDLVICDTRAPRQLAGSAYPARRQQCERAVATLKAVDPDIQSLRDVPIDLLEAHAHQLDPIALQRARFVLGENDRVQALAKAFATEDRTRIGDLMQASYRGAQEQFEMTIPAMDAAFDAMMSAPGWVGCRQAGGGFGGCLVALVESGSVDAFSESVTTTYNAATELTGAVYATGSAPGASALAL